MRVLVRTPNWLGDIVMALPVVTALRAHFAGARLAAAVPRAFAPLLSAVPEVDELLEVPQSGNGWRAHDAETALIREGLFDVVLLLPNSFGSAWVARRAGVPERWGFSGYGRRALLTRAVPRPRQRPIVHQVDEYLALAQGLGMEPSVRQPALTATARMVERAAGLLAAARRDSARSLVGIAPGAAYGHAKRWLPERYAGIIARLGRVGADVVLLGSAHDRDAGNAIESSLAAVEGGRSKTQVVNLIGRTDLSQLIGVLASCRTFISSDSGAMHLAAALGVPVTAMFGPTDDRRTAPLGPHAVLTRDVRCRPCFFRDCPIDHRCMTRISENEVYEAVIERLSPASTGGRP